MLDLFFVFYSNIHTIILKFFETLPIRYISRRWFHQMLHLLKGTGLQDRPGPNLKTKDYIMDYNYIKTLFKSNEERYTPTIMGPIASIECNCPMTIGGITHVNPSCRKYMPRRRTKVPAVFILGDVKDQEIDERMVTESDRMSVWDL